VGTWKEDDHEIDGDEEMEAREEFEQLRNFGHPRAISDSN
jgi:hypothetical protein